ncbi:MAG TPA: DNA alkylation repair protein [Polyangia bacterium]|nr:DNA alkylation repair protein [Polyangia bacterium]
MVRKKQDPGTDSPDVTEARRRLRAVADPAQVPAAQRFFRTGPGQYGEGDMFIGVKVPKIRALVRELDGLVLGDIAALLASAVHEERMLALLLLVRRFERCKAHAGRLAIHDLYLGNTVWVNSWDLVDATAPTLVGAFLEAGKRDVLYRLARSKSLWERRIAMVATLRLIRAGDIGDALGIAEILLGDREDLIHKAVGWMLREVGQRDREALERFLERHCREMPRTMLRYAIEKFPEPRRRRWLNGLVGKPALTGDARRDNIRR